jgi:hypothetical protein
MLLMDTSCASVVSTWFEHGIILGAFRYHLRWGRIPVLRLASMPVSAQSRAPL